MKTSIGKNFLLDFWFLLKKDELIKIRKKRVLHLERAIKKKLS